MMVKQYIEKLPPWARGARMWSGVFVAIVAVYAGAPEVGITLPRPAWISEVQAVDDVHSQRLSDLEMQLAGGLSDLSDKMDANSAKIQGAINNLTAYNIQRDLNTTKFDLRNTQAAIEAARSAGQAIPVKLIQDEVELETRAHNLQQTYDRLMQVIE